MIELEDVWKTYKMGDIEVHALRGLTMEVRKHEFVAIMGPSGSGKSTSVNMVGVLDIPSKGRILLEGHDITKYEESELAQIRGRKIGFVFQSFNLINTLSAKENVMLPMIFQGTSKSKRIERAEYLLKLVNLGERMDHKPKEMSGGEQQRVAIARSLANDPEIILADEPTGNLDSINGKMVMEFLRKLNRDEKKTIIMVTHDDKLAHFADRIVCLKDGMAVKEMKCGGK